MAIVGSLITLAGALFLLLGALGVLRMPDVYNRMQAGTKATTLGTILFLGGIAIGFPYDGFLSKVVILILFIIFTNPISSHVLARAAHNMGVKLADESVRDELAEYNERGES